MKLFFTSLMLTALGVSALAARRKNPAPYITRDGFRLCENLYVVRLQEGHTLEAHFEAIGMNLSQNATLFYPIAALNAYHARLDPYIVHELIRYDAGVVFVLHDHYDEGEDLAIDGDEFEESVEEAPKPSPDTVGEAVSENTSWQSIWYAQRTTMVVTVDLSTAYVEPLTMSTDGDDGSFEGHFWDDTAQTTTGPASADPGGVTSTIAPSSSSTGPNVCSGNQVEVSSCIPGGVIEESEYRTGREVRGDS